MSTGTAFGTGYTKTTCGTTPLTLYCSDSNCQSCLSYPADDTCQAVPGSSLTSVNFCSDATTVRASISALLASVVIAILAVSF